MSGSQVPIAAEPVRPAAVGGLFYSGSAPELAAEIRRFLAAVLLRAEPAGRLKALIVPHAGYRYSGPVAASAYSLVRRRREPVRRVVLLGPVHRVPVRGLALPEAQAFETPLGRIPIDREAVHRLRALRQVSVSRAAHAQEHSLEVQLPFLQQLLGEFTLVPLAVGDASPEEVAEVIDALWGGPETLIVVSSDLSHYLTYTQARRIDAETCAAIASLARSVSHEEACGGTPINGLIVAARRHRLAPTLLDLRSSGDTAGDRSRVVGYAAFAFHEPADDVR
jgi:AmmeMemoRadiSam system protein B